MHVSAANDPAFWRSRAAEARGVAAQMSDPLSRRAMLALVARYERLANRIARGVGVFGTAAELPSERSRGLDP
jgi:hypothetical protein